MPYNKDAQIQLNLVVDIMNEEFCGLGLAVTGWVRKFLKGARHRRYVSPLCRSVLAKIGASCASAELGAIATRWTWRYEGRIPMKRTNKQKAKHPATASWFFSSFCSWHPARRQSGPGCQGYIGSWEKKTIGLSLIFLSSRCRRPRPFPF